MDLSVDQVRIINSKTTGKSLIKGVAGSDKTSFALFKLAVMQKQKELQDEKAIYRLWERQDLVERGHTI